MMRRLLLAMPAIVSALVVFNVFFSPAPSYAASCGGSGKASDQTVLGFPTWYKYLKTEERQDDVQNALVCDVKIEGINDVWLIVAAVIEILLRVASLVAIAFIIYGGITYVISQGSPDKTKQALQTSINAVVGLAITVIAAAMVSFVANRFGG